jgi:protein O-GlcNAc transferase
MAGGMFVVAGQAQQAIPFFDKALAARPDHANALFELANAHLGRADPQAAEPYYVRSAAAFRRVLASPTAHAHEKRKAELLPTVLSNLGNTYLDLQRAREAIAVYEEAAASHPPTCLPFNGLSNAYEGEGRFLEALAASRRAIRMLPSTCHLAYYNLGRMLKASEQHMEAPAAYAMAVAIKPSDHQYVNGHGTALHAAGRLEEAVKAYKTATQLAPTWSSPYRNLGLLEYEQGGRSRQAIGWYRQTLALDPTSAETYCDMGTALLELGELAPAMKEYSHALTLNPSNPLAHANHLYLATKLCEWRDHEARHATLRGHGAQLLAATAARRLQPLQPAPFLFLPPYHALSYDGLRPEVLRELALAYAERAAERAGGTGTRTGTVTGTRLPLARPSSLDVDGDVASVSSVSSLDVDGRSYGEVKGKGEGEVNGGKGKGDRRLRVGYLSTDLGEHPTSHLMRSFWRLQHEHGRVRATCFARSNDGSEQRAFLMQTCEEWVELTGLSWAAAAQQIRQRRLHLLVDLNGHCGRPQFEILSLRAAPLQLTYMGHPGTSGASYVQYVLTDPIATAPRARTHFSEHLLSLPQWHVTDYRFSHAFNARGPSDRPTGLGEPPKGAPPAGPRRPWPEHATRATLGLPQNGFVLATFLQLYKVTPRVFDTWLNALRAAPITTRLWLLEFPRGAVTNLLGHAAANGISLRRLLSAPTAERSFHLARVALADLVLDSQIDLRLTSD